MSSAPVLTYLFADRVVPADTAFSVGTELPCSQVKVQTKALAATLFGVAVWDLAERGCLTVAVEQRKRLGFITTNPVIVRVTAPVPSGQVTLQDQIMALTADAEGRRIKDVVRDWFGRDVSDPYAMVIERVVSDALAEGCFEEIDAGRGKVASFLFGATELQPRCDVIEGRRAEAEALLARWQVFIDSEPELAQRLVDQCESAIDSRTLEEQEYDR